MTLAQVQSEPSFAAGIKLRDDIVFETAPALSYLIGWSRDKVRAYAKSRGWTVVVVWERTDENGGEDAVFQQGGDGP